jgi:glycosyltransferase involved in cell wall biosynthesis
MQFSLCLIARDEGLNLPRCLASLGGAVDELCVLDTGSRDGTAELAREWGARVECTTWEEDFARARNAALAMASGDWVLVLDADEELVTPPAQARALLEAFARAHPGQVGRLWIENLEEQRVTTRARVSRLLPRDERHRFAGRVHEQIVVGPEREEPQRADIELVVRHHGYSSAALVERDKLARNARLIAAAIEDDPTDGYLWFQLGRTRALSGDHVAALEALEGALALSNDADPWAIAALEEGAYALRALESSGQALELLEQVESRFTARPDTCFLIALLALDTGDLARAERGFRRCLELGAGDPLGRESSPDSATLAPAYNLGVMSEVLGRWDEARAHYTRALAFQPGHPPSLDALARLNAVCGSQDGSGLATNREPGSLSFPPAA